MMIDKNIPIPREFFRGKKIRRRYPWRKCEAIGDSFAVDEDLRRVLMAIRKFCQRNSEFEFNADIEEGGQYVRVWRTK